MPSNLYLPLNPFDGQVFIDAYQGRWIFNAEIDAWYRSGTAETIPVATDSIVGLMSAADKVLLDGINDAPGGFGLIVDPLAGSPVKPDGVLTGDISLVSDSIDITCTSNGLHFGLSQEFIDSFCLYFSNSRGDKGDKGEPGDKGEKGDPSYAFIDGPPGDKGPPGNDSQACKIVDVVLNDLDGTTDTPIVSLRVAEDETGACQLVYTTAKIDLTSGDGPNLYATPVSRSVVYPEDSGTCSLARLENWQLVKGNDDLPLNLQLIRLPKNEANEGLTGFNTYPLTTFVSDIVAHYNSKLTDLDADWQAEIKDYVSGKDATARGILSDLATQLAECEFKIPAEFCLDVEKCDLNPADQIKPFNVIVPKNSPCCCRDAPSDSSMGFGLYVGAGYSGPNSIEAAGFAIPAPYSIARAPGDLIKVKMLQDLGPLYPVWSGEVFANKTWAKASAKDAITCGGLAGRQTAIAIQCFSIIKPTRIFLEMRGEVNGANATNTNRAAIKISSCSALQEGSKPLPLITDPFVNASGFNNTSLSDANLRRYLLALTDGPTQDTGSYGPHADYAAAAPDGFPGVFAITDSYQWCNVTECVNAKRYKAGNQVIGPGNYVLTYFADWDAQDDMNDSYWAFRTSISGWGCA